MSRNQSDSTLFSLLQGKMVLQPRNVHSRTNSCIPCNFLTRNRDKQNLGLHFKVLKIIETDYSTFCHYCHRKHLLPRIFLQSSCAAFKSSFFMKMHDMTCSIEWLHVAEHRDILGLFFQLFKIIETDWSETDYSTFFHYCHRKHL